MSLRFYWMYVTFTHGTQILGIELDLVSLLNNVLKVAKVVHFYKTQDYWWLDIGNFQDISMIQESVSGRKTDKSFPNIKETINIIQIYNWSGRSMNIYDYLFFAVLCFLLKIFFLRMLSLDLPVSRLTDCSGAPLFPPEPVSETDAPPRVEEDRDWKLIIN